MTPKDIINQGLAKIGSSLISSYEQPRSPIEIRVSAAYPQWRDSEIRKRRWLFATTTAPLTPSGDSPIPNVERPYEFALPVDLLRLERTATDRWERRGQFLYDYGPTLTLRYIARKPEGEFDPAFIDVLAIRIAMELVEPTTQSNTKAERLAEAYKEAIAEAGRLNAYERGPETPGDNDLSDYSWVASRYGYA